MFRLLCSLPKNKADIPYSPHVIYKYITCEYNYFSKKKYSHPLSIYFNVIKSFIIYYRIFGTFSTDINVLYLRTKRI